jgi:hypothetical protein
MLQTAWPAMLITAVDPDFSATEELTAQYGMKGRGCTNESLGHVQSKHRQALLNHNRRGPGDDRKEKCIKSVNCRRTMH